MKLAAVTLSMILVASIPSFCIAEPVTSPADMLKAWGVDRGAGGSVQDGGTVGAHVDLRVQFAYDSADLTPQAIEQLRELAAALRDAAVESNSFRIEGHTDSTGSAGYNQALSARRARAVTEFLVGQGIAASRLQARGYGESRPIAANESAEGQAINRRVAVVNLGRAAPAEAPGPPVVPPRRADPVPGATPAAGGTASLLGEGADRPSVEVVVTYERNGRSARLEPGEVLNVIDNYHVRFTPTRKSYVYILQFDARGEVATIFPNSSYSEATNPVEAVTSYSIPSTGGWLKLRETPGEEEIVVLSSASAILDPPNLARAVRSGKVDDRGLPDLEGESPAEVPADLFSYRLPYKKTALAP